MSLNIHLFILITICFVSCIFGQPQISGKSTGVIEYKMQLYDTLGNQFSKSVLTINQRIWYKDSLVIEEVRSVKLVSDDTSSTQTTIIENYRFNDLRTRMAFEYKSFADTAKLIRKCSLDDTVKLYSGWNFKFKRKLEYRDIPEPLKDTSIDGISYRRVNLHVSTKSNPFLMTCYFRCDKKGTMFNYDPALSEMVGCPLVKVFTFSPTKQGTPTSSEINFLFDSLTDEESKVFDAWEKNEKRY